MTSLKASNENIAIRVLHVDDDPSLQEITKLMLLDLDGSFEIDKACCVDEAFKKLAAGNFDVVVSDFEMPQKNGLQFLSELREQNNEIPFILFTGKGREEVAIQALNLGADGYYDKQGSPETVYGELAHAIRTSFRNKKADELLRKSQAELKAIVYNAPLGIAISNSDMLFKSANEAFCSIVGYSEDELQKRSFRDITYPDDIEVSNKEMKELSCGKILFFSQEKRYVRKDGSIIDGRVTVSAIRNNEGKSVLYVAELEDITQRKQAEAELRGTFEVLERVSEGIDAGLAVIGEDYRVIWANTRFMNLGMASNKKCYQTFNNLGVVCPDCGVEKVFKQNLPLAVHEYKTVDSKGEVVWIELRVTPLKDKNGKTTAALELAIPITERKKAEEMLRNSDAKLRGIVEYSSDQIFLMDRNLNYLVVNNALAAVLGRSPEEIIGKSIGEVYGLETTARFSDNVKSVFETGKSMFLEEKMVAQGRELFISTSLNPIKDNLGNVTAVTGIVRDISERKKVEEKLRQSDMIFKNSLDLFCIAGFDGCFKVLNPAWERTLGWSEEELLSKPYVEFVHPQDKEATVNAKSKLANGIEVYQFVNRYFCKDGTIRWLSWNAVPYPKERILLAVARDITKEKLVEEQTRRSDLI